jgi:hypothetical protein
MPGVSDPGFMVGYIQPSIGNSLRTRGEMLIRLSKLDKLKGRKVVLKKCRSIAYAWPGGFLSKKKSDALISCPALPGATRPANAIGLLTRSVLAACRKASWEAFQNLAHHRRDITPPL